MAQTIKESWENHIKTEIQKIENLKSLEWDCRFLQWDIEHAADVWDISGFNNRDDAKYYYRQYFVSCLIRTYFRRNKITTRKGSTHTFDCRREHFLLWNFATRGHMDGKMGNMRWWYRKVDGLKNLYVMF